MPFHSSLTERDGAIESWNFREPCRANNASDHIINLNDKVITQFILNDYPIGSVILDIKDGAVEY